MPTLPISTTFTDYLHQNSHTPLQITFATLTIRNHQNGQFLNRVQRQQSSIILQKLPQTGLAEITVLDNLVFSFSFQFRIPRAKEFHNIEMLSMPRPLDCGRLFVDKEKLRLSFRIDAPDPSLRVEVTHTYQGVCGLKELCAPVSGQSV
ncbi:MAG: hypothetical protein H2058_06465 [Muricauda sp.]|nr:hypothetical protein [Allomuricauda sp.]MBA4744881.1 hypothetical protein [Allomuricauda sp.]